MNSSAPILVFAHKQATSARTRFVLFNESTICAFEHLPPMVEFLEGDGPDGVALLPGALAAEAAAKLGVSADTISVVVPMLGRLSTADGEAPVFLAELTTMDPPFEAMEQVGGRFIAITEARAKIGDAEMLLLRKAYETLMGG